MIVAKEFKSINVRKYFKNAISSSYSYSIYNITMPLKMSKKNISKYSLHENNKDLGVILNNVSTLDRYNNTVLFNDKKAYAQSFQNKTIIKLLQPSDENYTKWIETIKPYIQSINPSFLMIPINNFNILNIRNINLVIQELNTILFSFAYNSFVVFYQKTEPISVLSYIINHTAFPTKTSLCLDLDFMENDFYTLKDILNDIIKFNILNRISIIKTDKYTLKDKEFKKFLSTLPEDVIVYGEKI